MFLNPVQKLEWRIRTHAILILRVTKPRVVYQSPLSQLFRSSHEVILHTSNLVSKYSRYPSPPILRIPRGDRSLPPGTTS